MEATGIYWGILYEMLEEAGIDVWLVDGVQTKQVPGRKTDVKDCQWIQQLHSYGLLNRCFVADSDNHKLKLHVLHGWTPFVHYCHNVRSAKKV
jgi:hypothetical protein